MVYVLINGLPQGVGGGGGVGTRYGQIHYLSNDVDLLGNQNVISAFYSIKFSFDETGNQTECSMCLCQ